ncbi:hypothetical protein CYFUS_000106 [Cystobacter fuscus]|uniref:Lipoprotein n=1 Tax=Cystobacter fuscus TaxID=43 RepID=A0A250ISI2_9BACT|nr:hypothetical protein CYFUS_000106 [Cystobacter fuscus]
MHRGHILVLLWVLFASAACPHAFRKGGAIDQSILKDMYESFRPMTRTDCEPATLRTVCLPEKFVDCERQCKEDLAASNEEEEG